MRGRGEGGVLSWRNKEFSTATVYGIQQDQVEPVIALSVCVCVQSHSASLFYFPPPPLLSPLCLSPSNKAEYLFPPLRLSGLLKGVRDLADIRRYMCVCLYVRL